MTKGGNKLSDQREIIQPKEVFHADGFTHAIKTKGNETIYISGQLPWNKNFQLIGEKDIRKQTIQAMKNIQSILIEAGADWENLVQLTTYTTNPEENEIINDAKTEIYKGVASPTDTLIGVNALADPKAMIEIQAIAVI